jgi:clan AA aspartic protease (TIGR02281 family)
MLAVGGGGALVLVVVLAAMLSRSGPEPSPGGARGDAATPSTAAPGKQSPAQPERARIVLEWAAGERSGGTVYVDGRERVLMGSDPVELQVTPGRHQLALERPGYQRIETEVECSLNAPARFTPVWQAVAGPEEFAVESPPPTDTAPPAGGTAPPEMPGTEPAAPTATETPPALLSFDDWLQDLEAAKQQAAEQQKHVLLLFHTSDGDELCQRLASEILLTQEFRSRAAQDYVLVCLDFGKTPAAEAKVQDPVRNSRLRARFWVSAYPTVVVTDESGQAYGYVKGYDQGGVDGYLNRLQRLRAGGKQLPVLRRAIDSAPDEAAKRENALAAVQLLHENGFDQQQIVNWLNAPPPPEPKPSAQPAESAPAKVELTDADLQNPKQALEKLSLRAQNEFFCLTGDVEFRAQMNKAGDLRSKAFKAQQQAAAVELEVQKTEQAIRDCLQKRVHLRAQLNVGAELNVVNAFNALGEQIMVLQKTQKDQEAAAKQARADANGEAEKYVEFVLTARRLFDQVTAEYKRLAGDPKVQTAIEGYNATSTKRVQLGPSRYFLSEEKKLKDLERSVLSEEVSIRRGDGDLWYVSVMFNGKSAQEMAIDTGASLIAMPWQMAQATGLTPGPEAPVIQVQMADGRVVEAQTVVAKTVRVGKFTVENVTCGVMPPDFTQAGALLGQTFLKHFTYKIDAARSKLVMSQLEAKGTR